MVLTVCSMFFQLLFIHLFRPFLKYTQQTSPLPQNVSPRKLCTQAAGMISKLMRLYKRSHGLRQICNIVVYITHSACTIHLLNMPDKNAKRDIIHGIKHLEEIAEGWPCARRTLAVLSVLARKWKIELPEEAVAVLNRTDAKFGTYTGDVSSPPAPRRLSEQVMPPPQPVSYPQPQMVQAPSYPQMPMASNMNGGPASLSFGGVPGMVRPSSNTFAPPPSDANGLRAAQMPSATTTPSQSAQGRHHGRDSVTTNGASPSDMFGGVEQLIRDSQDWVYRDQAQYASGFGNWTSLEMDAAGWSGSGGVIGTPMTPINAQMNGNVAVMNTSPVYSNTSGLNGMPQAANGYPVSNWLNGLNSYDYNEAEWYL